MVVSQDNFDNVPAVPVREELDDVIHIEKAVKQMKCNKASGGVTAFIFGLLHIWGRHI